MMFARLALESDVERLVEMAIAALCETMPGEPYDEARVRATIQRSFDTANPTVFVVEQCREVVGFVEATLHDYDYRDGFFVAQKVLYVSPDHRGTRAAVLLMRELVAWSGRLGAAEIMGGNHNGFCSDRTAGFLGHFGFEKSGYAMTRRLADG